jgi:hypothetical protein
MNETTLIHCKRFTPFTPNSFPVEQDAPAGKYEDVYMTQEEYDETVNQNSAKK